MMVAVADNMPDDCESSAMAFLMAISNIFGGDLLAPLCGSWLLDGLKIKRGQYDNLVWAVTVRTIARLIPIPFIWWLIPAGSSLDKVLDVTVFLIDMERDFAGYNEVYAEYFEGIQAARTTVAIRALPTPIAVEFKVIAQA